MIPYWGISDEFDELLIELKNQDEINQLQPQNYQSS